MSAPLHPLHYVFEAAIKQATHGKGERHGGSETPFMEQPWFHYAKMHGRGFLTGQAAKKLEEAASKREGQPFIDEVYGAMVYLGMAVIREELRMKAEKAEIVQAMVTGRHSDDGRLFVTNCACAQCDEVRDRVEQDRLRNGLEEHAASLYRTDTQ